MFGLHVVPMLMIIGAIMVLVALGLGFIILKRREPEFAGVLSGVLVLVAVVVVIIGIAAFPKERELDARDAIITAKLASEQMELVDVHDWEQRVVVHIPGCTASFQLQPNSAADGVWPLVPGTGRDADGWGCNGPGLDELFIPVR